MVGWRWILLVKKSFFCLQKMCVADQTLIYLDLAIAVRRASSRKHKFNVSVCPLQILCDCGSAVNNHQEILLSALSLREISKWVINMQNPS